MARILVIDDDEQFRFMLRRILEHAGYEVAEAGNGEDGQRIYRDRPSDLVIVDLIMPEKEGLETIMELRHDFPHIKIIAISGGGRIGPEGYLEVAKNVGAVRALAKPVERQELLAALQDSLR